MIWIFALLMWLSGFLVGNSVRDAEYQLAEAKKKGKNGSDSK